MKIYYDIFEKISEYVNVNDLVNLLLVDKRTYDEIYKNNRYNCNLLFTKKIFYEMGLGIVTSGYGKYASNIGSLFNLYNYFRNHKRSGISDYMIYIVENHKYETDLFRLFASKCVYRNSNYRDTSDRVIVYNFDNWGTDEYNRISFNDMNYMILYSEDDQFLILLETFDVPITFLTYKIKQLLSKCYDKPRPNRDVEALNNLLKKCIKYIFTKYCISTFDDYDSTYVHSIVCYLIAKGCTNVLKYFLVKKRQYMVRGKTLDYQLLVNRCVEICDRVHLQMLLEENKRDNASNKFIKCFVIINTQLIIEHCDNGNFDYIGFLVDKYLGRAINTKIYIDCICQGIESIVLSKELFKLKNINNLARYLSQDNKLYLNNYIEQLYDLESVNENIRIFISI